MVLEEVTDRYFNRHSPTKNGVADDLVAVSGGDFILRHGAWTIRGAIVLSFRGFDGQVRWSSRGRYPWRI